MKGTWNKHKGMLLTAEAGKVTVKKAVLFAMDFRQLCMLCYDPETPSTVVKALWHHPFASVRAATKQRNAVLTGELLNPFEFSN